MKIIKGITENFNSVATENMNSIDQELEKINSNDLQAMNLYCLQNFFEQQMNQLYEEENFTLQAIEIYQSRVTSLELSEKLTKYLEKIELQIIRLDDIFLQLKLKTEIKQCIGIRSVICEGELAFNYIQDKKICDIAIIALIRKIIYYKIASYVNLQIISKDLNYFKTYNLLQETLKDERSINQELIAFKDDKFKSNREVKV